MGDFSTGIVSPLSDVFFDPGAPTTVAQAISQCQALNIYDPANQIPMIMGEAKVGVTPMGQSLRLGGTL